MTEYTSQAADLLTKAKDFLDQSMTWNTTPEGSDYWEEVSNALEERILEAETQSNGANAPASPPPLHSLTPRPIGSSAGAVPIVQPTAKRQGQARAIGAPIVKPTPKPASEEVIHIWMKGGAVCGIRGEPWEWPPGHSRVSKDDVKSATCLICCQKAAEISLAEKLKKVP